MQIIKKLKLISLIIGLTVLIIFTYSLVNYSLLKNQIEESLEEQVEKYGYIAIFTLSFILEVSPQPFASAIVPYANGLILGLNPQNLFITTIIGVILASFTAYILGITYGKRITVRFVGEENYDKSYEVFKKYGKPGMTILALTPIPYFPILAGIFKMSIRDFIIFAVIPRIFHFIVFGYVLYLILV